MIILLDAMGGDNAPEATIKGAVKAINDIKAEVVLIGNKEIINTKIKEFYGKDDIKEISPRLSIHHTTETIEMVDIPTQAIKHKKDSSMVVGFNMLKEGKGDVFISAGNSGALLTGATLLVGRIKGIDRPALAGILPSYKNRLMLMDCGSNTNCKPINLLQFAQMASIYLKNTFNMDKNPTVGLLNIGTEETKGNELIKESTTDIKEDDVMLEWIQDVKNGVNPFSKKTFYHVSFDYELDEHGPLKPRIPSWITNELKKDENFLEVLEKNKTNNSKIGTGFEEYKTPRVNPKASFG